MPVPSVKAAAATYFNMAVQNLYKTLSHILFRVGVRLNGIGWTDSRMSPLLQSIKPTLTASQQMAMQRMLFRHFPVLSSIMSDVTAYAVHHAEDGKSSTSQEGTTPDAGQAYVPKGSTFEQMVDTLSTMIEAMTFYRNEYSHNAPYRTEDEHSHLLECENKIWHWLDVAFTYNRNLVKKNERLSDERFGFLVNYDANDRMYRTKVKVEVKKNGKLETREEWRFYERSDFYFRIALPREVIDSTSQSVKTGKKRYYDQQVLTDYGRMLLCCCFLRAQDIPKFISDARLFDKSPYGLSKEELGKAQQRENQRANEAEQERLKNPGNTVNPIKPKTITAWDSPEHDVMVRIMRRFHLNRPLSRRVDSESTQGTLIMDVMNELRRCPRELYDTFGEKGKASFEHDANLPGEALNDDGSAVDNNIENGKVKLVRHVDRFPQLALRMIDEMKLFNDVRFQLRLGNYRFNFYDKTCVDGTPAVRAWQKEINGYGRWQEVERERKIRWNSLFQKRVDELTEQVYGEAVLQQPVPDTADTTPYITDYRTAYNIHANRIGMRWNLAPDADGKKLYIPDLKTEVVDGKNRAPVSMPAPMCTMSVYDLPAMLFYQHLRDLLTDKNINVRDVPTAEKIITSKYEVLRRLFELVAANKMADAVNLIEDNQLKESELPKKLCQHPEIRSALVKIRTNSVPQTDKAKFSFKVADRFDMGVLLAHAILRLDSMMTSINRRLDSFEEKKTKIGTKENKPWKSGFVDIRYGVLARQMARSIMRWQPTCRGGRDKLTGMNYNRFVAVLATYGRGCDMSRLKQVLSESKIYDQQSGSAINNPHPFIDKVLRNNASNLEDLYYDYLYEEYLHAEACLRSLLPGNKKFGNDEEYYSTRVQEYAEELLSSKTPMQLSEKQAETLAAMPFLRGHGLASADASERQNFCDYSSYASRLLKMAACSDAHNALAESRDATILLPDGLFTEALRNALHVCLLEENVAKLGWDSAAVAQLAEILGNPAKATPAYLIRFYLQHILHDAPQAFYDPDYVDGRGEKVYRRAYKPFTTMYGERVGKSTVRKPYMMDGEMLSDALKSVNTANKANSVITEYADRLFSEGVDDLRIKNLNPAYFEKLKKKLRAKCDDEKPVLQRQINEVRLAERAIRRFREQDTVLFLAVRRLLVDQLTGIVPRVGNSTPDADGLSQDRAAIRQQIEPVIANLRLEDFSFDNDFRFLDTIAKGAEGDNAFSMTYTYSVKPSKKNAPEDARPQRSATITIVQHNLSLKNYGNVYRVLCDSRLDSLMDILADAGIKEVSFNDIVTEFANFERYRNYIFDTAFDIECRLHQPNASILNNPIQKKFWKDDINSGLSKDAKRNSHAMMLKLSNQTTPSKDEDGKPVLVLSNIAQTLREARNGAGHNVYRVPFNVLRKTANWYNNERKDKDQIEVNVPNIAYLTKLTVDRLQKEVRPGEPLEPNKSC